jgi:hypothetical protein
MWKFAFLIFGVVYCEAATSDLHLRTSPTTESLLASDRNRDLIVAVGKNGTIITSDDSLVWKPQQSGTGATLRGVAFGNSAFVAVGGDGNSGLILVSTNGLNWSIGLTSSNQLNAIKYGDGKFVAVGNSGSMVISTNATNFLVSQIGSSDLNAVAFAVALTGSSAPQVPRWISVGNESAFYTSADGFIWTQRFAPSSKQFVGAAGMTQFSAGSVVFIAVTSVGELFSSQDGKTWDAMAAPEKFDATGATSRGAFGNGAAGIFAIFGARGKLFTSMDGIAWNAVFSSTTNTIRSATLLNGGLLAVGDDGTIAGGHHFVVRKSFQGVAFDSAAAGNNRLMIGASNDSLFYSSDVHTWQVAPITGHLLGFANGKFVVDKDNRVEISSDGATWTEMGSFAPTPSGTVDSKINGIGFENGYYVVVQSYTVQSSPLEIPFTRTQSSTNLMDWQPSEGVQAVNSVLRVFPKPLTFGNGRFLWANPNLYVSIDGKSWTKVFAENVEFTGLAFSGEKFLGLTGNIYLDGSAYSSPDAEHWFVTNGVRVRSLIYGNNVFAAASEYNSIPVLQLSRNGTLWEENILDSSISAIVSFRGTFVIAANDGNEGLILQSNPMGQVELLSNLEGGKIAIREVGRTGQSSEIQQSLDFINWENFAPVPSEGLNGPILMASTNQSQFFRAVVQ